MDEYRERQRKKFRALKFAESQPSISYFFDGADTLPAMNDEELARKLQQEERDSALARRVQESDLEYSQDDLVILSEAPALDGTTSDEMLAKALQMSLDEEQSDEIVILDDVDDTSYSFPSTSSNKENASVVTSVTAEFSGSVSEMRGALFQHPNADSGFTVTSDITERLHRALTSDRFTSKFMLSAPCSHFSSVGEDLGGWACGYRNAQLMISSFPSCPAFAEQFAARMGGMFVPSILCIQTLIKNAWTDGWDPLGAHEHNNSIVGSKNWIGPVDLYSMFMFLGIECKIVTFHRSDKSKGPHPELFRWCRNYFSEPGKPPLFLQHHGHSRSVVGWEERKDGEIMLLISDPGQKKERISWTGSDWAWTKQNFRRTMKDLNHEHFELLYLTGRILSPDDVKAARIYDQRNGIRGERIVS